MTPVEREQSDPFGLPSSKQDEFDSYYFPTFVVPPGPDHSKELYVVSRVSFDDLHEVVLVINVQQSCNRITEPGVPAMCTFFEESIDGPSIGQEHLPKNLLRNQS
jgi:hypothetical protein